MLPHYIDVCQYIRVRTTLPIVECCPPLLDSPLAQAEAEQVAAAFKVIADPARLWLLSILAGKPEREACVCDLVAPLDLSQPTVSHHLKVLYEAGLLSRQRRGRSQDARPHHAPRVDHRLLDR
jgi:ArsR family transcriptional regulator